MKARTISALAVFGVVLGATRPVHAECSDDQICSGGPLRIMFVIDGSSDLLNDADGPASMGSSGWDHLRAVLALDDAPPGDDSIYRAQVDAQRNIVISQIAHVGLIAFGSAEQTVRVVDYGPCTRDNLEWALDPQSSCASPGCTNPWGGPPIEWTFVDGSEVDPPGFIRETWSTMPQCEGASTCSGSSRAVHAGIELATENQADYEASTGYTHDDGTTYLNILLVSDSYAGASNDMEVQTALEAAFAAGTTTHVIAFGPLAADPMPGFATELENMAEWGSGGTLAPRFAVDDAELHDAIQELVADQALPCCHTIDCSQSGGADEGGIGNEGGDDAADGAEWGSLDGEGDASASADGADASADASDSVSDSASDTSTAEAGFDDDGGCRCSSGRSTPLGMLVLVLLGLRRRRR